MTKLSAVFGIGVVLCLGGTGFAQPIAVEVDGNPYGTFADGANVPIDLTSISPINSSLLVRIYDSQPDGTGLPQHSVGKVTITGRASNGGHLLVLVAGSSQTSFPFTAQSLLLQGAIDLGGNANGGIIIQPDAGHLTDTTLRDAARVAVAISGDAYGTIDAAQIFTLQALGRNSTGSPVQLLGGNIYSNLTARGIDDTDQTAFFKAIPYIQAGTSIQGTIQATGVAATASPGSIQLVIVGATNGTDAHASSPQITGDILAPQGTIEEIWCTGPIGTAAHHATIEAGTRIGRISLRDQGNPGNDPDVVNANLYADVNTSALDLPNSFPISSTSLIETGGDFYGSIQVYDFQAQSGDSIQRPQSGRKGIFVGGDFYGDITSKYDWSHADMIARSFRGTITIGQMFEGAIVAVGRISGGDADDGTIETIDIGNNGLDYLTAPVHNGHGFTGGYYGPMIPPPFEGADRDKWYVQTAQETGMVDSVIRADQRITNIHISNMASNLYQHGGTKPYRPRIESPTIVALNLDSFESGVVWSGKLNSPGTTVTNDITDDYADIGEISIGCVGPRADLWYKSCLLVEVLGDMFGEIHVPDLAAYQVIRIGKRFGDYVQASYETTTCTNDLPYTFDSIGTEDSPRGFWAAIEDNHNRSISGPAPYGRVLVREPYGFRGQVVIDNLNDSNPVMPRPRDYTLGSGFYDQTAHWLGDVEVGTGDGTDPNIAGDPWVISTFEDRAAAPGQTPYFDSWAKNDLLKPEYRIKDGYLGFGSVGMIPYDLDHTNSMPRSDCIWDTGCNRTGGPNISIPIIGVEDFTGDGIMPVFFGPIRLGSTVPGSQHIRMYHCYADGYPDTSHDYGADGSIEVTVAPNNAAPFSRVLKVRLLDDSLRGRFMFKRYEGPDSYHGLLSDQSTGTYPVDDFTYNFFIGDGGSCPGGDCSVCCDGDFNCDGDVGTDADIESFFACLAGNCPPCRPNADFNCDGDVGNDTDIESFFRVLAGGSC